ncbi:MAG: hypothetical protein IT322_11150 [Anaerolineae bacterium]|nr:hypothetical protein [Anaerolineae bacterium]
MQLAGVFLILISVISFFIAAALAVSGLSHLPPNVQTFEQFLSIADQRFTGLLWAIALTVLALFSAITGWGMFIAGLIISRKRSRRLASAKPVSLAPSKYDT